MTESEGMPLSEVLFGNEPSKPASVERELADALSHWLATDIGQSSSSSSSSSR
jgi:hypothetical protein